MGSELLFRIDDGDAIFRKRHIEESDEARYAEMNARFHSLILQAADSQILSAALERNNRVPFAAPQALAFDKTNLEQTFDMLHYAHRQHHAIVEALERGESARAESLMREHAIAVKQSINVNGFHVPGNETARRLSVVR